MKMKKGLLLKMGTSLFEFVSEIEFTVSNSSTQN